jgi:excisionase family DNA binding protein
MVGALLPVREAAQALAVSRQRVHQLIGAGALDAAQPGREWLVTAGSVQALLDRRRTRRPRARRRGGRA